MVAIVIFTCSYLNLRKSTSVKSIQRRRKKDVGFFFLYFFSKFPQKFYVYDEKNKLLKKKIHLTRKRPLGETQGRKSGFEIFLETLVAETSLQNRSPRGNASPGLNFKPRSRGGRPGTFGVDAGQNNREVGAQELPRFLLTCRRSYLKIAQ